MLLAAILCCYGVSKGIKSMPQFSSSMPLLLLAFIASCAGHTSRIRTDEMPTGREAYIYGTFLIRAERTVYAGGTQGLGFSISCQDGAKYVIGFAAEDPLAVIKVAPSACLLKELVYSSDGMFLYTKPAPSNLSYGFQIAPGKAYYLGDFVVTTNQSKDSGVLDRTWALADVRDNYAEVTAKVKKAFVNLAGIPTEDRTIGGKGAE
jgi:hypothetical protein